jgi:Rrf2 family iron-sulfur cluster assembly transcriptional regulator
MNLTLSRRGDYVVRSAVCLALAHRSAEPRKIRQVVAEMGVPATFASQILADLVRAGIATSKAGRSGGYRLARTPQEISILEVIEAGEGPLQPDRCALGEEPCRFDAVCPLHDTWMAAAGALREVLAATSLEAVADREGDAAASWVPAELARLASRAVALRDSVHVELPAAVVIARLSAGTAWLTPLARAAHADGEQLRMRLSPGGFTWLGKTVLVSLGAPLGGEDTLRIPLSWEATGTPGLFPELDAELTVTTVDPERAELTLSGRYHPPLGRAGHTLDEALFHRVAAATVRGFLLRVARSLEETAPAQPAPGPRPVPTGGRSTDVEAAP